MFSPLRTLACLIVFALTPALPAQAQSLGDILKAELLPGWRTESGTHMAALRLQLAGGWKTYWRSPGEAGIPPEFNWSGSENVARVRLHWPVPEVFDFNGMQSIGYSRELILPIEIEPHDASRPVQLTSQVELGVCRDICVPAELRLSRLLSPAGQPDPAIRRAIAARPLSPGRAGLKAARCRLTPATRGAELTVDLDLPPLGPGEVVVLEAGDGATWISDTVSQRNGRILQARAQMSSLDGQALSFDRSSLHITVLAAGKAVETRGCQGG